MRGDFPKHRARSFPISTYFLNSVLIFVMPRAVDRSQRDIFPEETVKRPRKSTARQPEREHHAYADRRHSLLAPRLRA
jgi:hypothetical protein